MADALLRRNRSFRLIFSASAVSNLGDGVSALALPWLASLFSRDPMLIAMVAVAQRLPWFLFALPAGVWTDRADRRLLMVRADLVRLVLALGIVALILAAPPLPLPEGQGGPMIAVLSLLAFLIGTAEVLRDNSAQTVLPQLVAKDDLETANGQLQSAEQVMGQFAGPPLAGLLIGLGVALPFGFDAATFAVAAGLVWLIPLPPRTASAGAPFLAALKEGFVWMRAHPAILRLALMLSAFNLIYTASLTMLVLYGQEVLGLSAFGYGLLLTLGAAGGVAGGLLSPVIAARLGARQSLLAAVAVFTLCQLGLGLTASVPLAAGLLFFDAFGGILWNVVTVSYRQRVIPDDILGRVNAIYRFFGWGMMPAGALAGGALVAGFEPVLGREAALAVPFLFAAGGGLGLFAYAALRLRF
jgi:MFS family permease